MAVEILSHLKRQLVSTGMCLQSWMQVSLCWLPVTF